MVRLAELPNIVGLKDATANLERGAELLRQLPPRVAVYSGDDATGLALMLLGGRGIISVTANVAPRVMHEMCVAALKPEPARARELNNRLMGLHRHLFVEANPIPVKWAVASMRERRKARRRNAAGASKHRARTRFGQILADAALDIRRSPF